jgi:alpha-2-macroglobulin
MTNVFRIVFETFLALFQALAGIVRALVGDVQYTAPDWLHGLSETVRRHPKRILAILLALSLAVYGIQLWRNRPVPVIPNLVYVTALAPSLTDYSQERLSFYPAQISFSGSVAPLDAVGKAPNGLVMQPTHPGNWSWTSDRELVFTPSQDWPVGQLYNISFDPKKMLAAQAVIDKNQLEFSTAEFQIQAPVAEFYQDPEKADIKRGVYTLSFSHPIDSKKFEPLLRLSVGAEADGAIAMPVPNYNVSYHPNRLTAYIKTDPLQIPKRGASLTLNVAPGSASTLGGRFAKELSGTVVLPSRYSLSLQSAELSTAEQENGDPQRLLILEFNQEVSDATLNQALKLRLLPRDKTKRESLPHAWRDEEVSEQVLAQSAVLKPIHIPGERADAKVHRYRIEAPAHRHVFVQLPAEMPSFSGFLLPKLVAKSLAVEVFEPQLRFVGDGTLLSLKGERKVSVMARSVGPSTVHVARVLPGQLHHFVHYQDGELTKPYFYGMSSDALTERFEVNIPPAPRDGSAQYHGIDLGRYFTPERHGVFLLQLQSTAQAEEAKESSASDENESQVARGAADGHEFADQGDIRLVVLSDLGAILKTTLNDEHEVFVQQLSSGDPGVGVKVDVIGTNGLSIMSALTDASGRATLPSWSDFKREKEPILLQLERDGDLSFLPINKQHELDYSRYDIGGEDTPVDTGQLSAHLFSDRGLYRPGDTFHVGVIVRALDWKKPLQGLPLKYRIEDPRGQIVASQPLQLNAAGFMELAYTPSEVAPTGSYQITLEVTKKSRRSGDTEDKTPSGDDEDQYLASTTVAVKEFLPDRTKVQARFNSANTNGADVDPKQGAAWVSPEGLQALVSAQTLFGTAANGRRVSGSINLSPSLPAFASFPGFRFFDPQKPQQYYQESLAELQSSETGETVFPLNLSNYAAGSYQLQFWSEVFEPGGGRSVSAQSSIMVSSSAYLLGLKCDDPTDWITKGASRTLQWLTVNAESKAIALEKPLKTKLLYTHYVSTLTKQDSGLYKYVSQEKVDVVKESSLAVKAGVNKLMLDTQTPGQYTLEFYDSEGLLLNSFPYWVAGAANLTRSLERNAELQLSLSKDSYRPGEWLEFNIRAPYLGSGLITIERDKIYAHTWFKADTTSSLQRIQIPENLEAGAYLNVQFIRDPQSAEVFMSPLTYTIAPFKIDLAERRLALSVQSPELVKPGSTIEFKLKVSEASQVALFAVDEGILRVARYRLADPLDSFFPKRSLQVKTEEILDLILPEFSRLNLTSAPGGGGEEELGANLNPFKRKREKPATYWSGVQSVDGERSFSYQVPDTFNGTLKIMAVAVAPERISTFESSMLVRADFVISPSMPSVLAPGDEAVVGVGVARPPLDSLAKAGDEMAQEVLLSATPSAGLKLLSPAVKLSLKPGQEAVAEFRVQALQALGSAELRFAASSAGKSAALSASTSIRPVTAFRRVVQSGNFKTASRELGPLRSLRPEFASRTLAASSSPFVVARGLIDFIGDSGNQCSEQLASMAIAQMVSERNPSLQVSAKLQAGQASALAGQSPQWRSLLATLSSRQNSEGGFGLWVANPQAEPWLSGYVSLMLLEASERGHQEAANLLVPARRYLQTLAADESDSSMAHLRARAMASYLLTRMEQVTTRELASIEEALAKSGSEEWQDDVISVLLAASHQLLKQHNVANDLLSKRVNNLNATAVKTLADFHEFGLYDASVDDALSAYIVLRHFGAGKISAAGIDRLLQPLELGVNHTLSSALSLLALEGFAKQRPPIVLQLQQQMLGANMPWQNVADGNGLIVADLASTSARASIRQNGSERIWYVLSDAGFDQQASSESAAIEIARQFYDVNGRQEVRSLTLGEVLEVRVQLRSKDQAQHSQIAIIDLLPAGFEVEDNGQGDYGYQRISVAGGNMILDSADVREDRIVLYTSANRDLSEFRYQIKATNVGRFAVPAALASGMYDRRVQAVSTGVASLEVLAPVQAQRKAP